MAKTKEKEHKSRKKLSRTAKENWAIGIVALLILLQALPKILQRSQQ